MARRVGGRPLGSFGDVAVFAFYPNKQITTGEGGMVVTDDPALAEVMRSLRNQGRDADGTWLRHVRLGYNYRLDELSAARRRRPARAARASCMPAAPGSPQPTSARSAGIDWVKLPRAGAGEVVDWFVYVVRLHAEIDRDGVIGRLAEAGVPSRPYFSPLHLQPFYRADVRVPSPGTSRSRSGSPPRRSRCRSRHAWRTRRSSTSRPPS